MDNPPVRLVSRTPVFTNSVWTVYRNHIVSDPNGAEVRDYVTIGPRARMPDGIGGVAVLPQSQGRLGLVRTYRHPVGAYAWELPRGFVDPGENPADAALRELAEETALVCEPADLVPLGLVAPESSTFTTKVALFVATDCRSGGQRSEDEPGLGELSWFAPDQIRGMLDSFEIEDAATLAALYRFLR